MFPAFGQLFPTVRALDGFSTLDDVKSRLARFVLVAPFKGDRAVFGVISVFAPYQLPRACPRGYVCIGCGCAFGDGLVKCVKSALFVNIAVDRVSAVAGACVLVAVCYGVAGAYAVIKEYVGG